MKAVKGEGKLKACNKLAKTNYISQLITSTQSKSALSVHCCTGTESCRTSREVRSFVLHCCDAGLCITVPICTEGTEQVWGCLMQHKLQEQRAQPGSCLTLRVALCQTHPSFAGRPGQGSAPWLSQTGAVSSTIYQHYVRAHSRAVIHLFRLQVKVEELF